MGRGVLRLEVGVRDEGIDVVGLDDFGGSGQGGIGIAVFSQDAPTGLEGFLFRLGDETIPALGRDFAFVPHNFELLAGGHCGPR